jgi:hypothetical protein
MAGTFASSAALRGLCWGIDGVALVMASALLTVQLPSFAKVVFAFTSSRVTQCVRQFSLFR